MSSPFLTRVPDPPWVNSSLTRPEGVVMETEVESGVSSSSRLISASLSRIPEWTALVTKEVTGVRDAFEQHVLVTEKPGGLYEEIIMRAPRLDGTLKRLRDEHPDISSSIEQMLDRLEHTSIGGPDWPLEDARDDLQRFIGRVIRHRQKGADLVWEAYNVDIGGTE